MKNLFEKSYWKKAGGEILSFIVVVPCLFILILTMISVAKIGIEDQILNFCTYNCCRAAVVSTSMTTAEDRAVEIYAEQYGIDKATVISEGYISLEIIEGHSWEKGALLQCTITRNVNSLLSMLSGQRTQTIIMMIENGGVI